MKVDAFFASLCAALVLGLGSGLGLLRCVPVEDPAPRGAQFLEPNEPASAARTASEVLRAIAKTNCSPSLRGGRGEWVEIACAAPAELGALIETLRGDNQLGTPTVLYAFQRLALHHPRRALELALQPNTQGGRDAAALSTVLGVLAQTRPADLPSWLAAFPPLERRQLEERWLEALGQEDPAAALSAAERLPNLSPLLVGAWIGQLAGDAPTDALARVASLPNASQRTAGIAAVLEKWSRSDPKAATAWLLAQKGLREAARHWKILLAVRVEQDPRAAADLVASGATGLEPGPLLKPLLKAWGEKDLASARAWIELRSPEERSRLLVELLPVWVKQDPARALDFGVSAPLEWEDLGSVREALRKWKLENPAEAAKWLRQLPAGIGRERAVEAWAATRPASVEDARAALEMIRDLPGGPAKSERRAMQVALQHLTALDLDAGLNWANGLPPAERAAALREIVRAGAAQAPARIGALLQSLPLAVPSNEERNQTLQLFHPFAQDWARRDVLAAANWTVGLSDRQARDAALSGLATAWVEEDPTAAWRWALAQGPPMVNAACREVLREWAEQDVAAALAAVRQLPPAAQAVQLPRVLGAYAAVDPAAAAQLAESLPDSRERQRLLGEIAQSWLGRDAAAARPWIERNRAAFDPADRERLRGR